jgi:hypothetical protein
MLRSSLFSASAILLCCATTASAQQQIQARKVLGAVKDAGIYHVVTGTWTRNNSSANLGPDIIYRNDHASGYFGTGWEGSNGVDEGILPGPGNPKLGSQKAYLIDGLSFSYCAQGVGPTLNWDLELYDSYVGCDDPDNLANCANLVWTMATGGVPSAGCWLVTFDLSGGAEACLEADGGTCAPGYQGGALGLDGFGFGQLYDSSAGGGFLAGPILSGNPNWAPRGDGTCYQPNMTCAAGATGLGEQDLFGIGTPSNGCFWFGGYNNTNGCGLSSQGPTGSMNRTLFADCTDTCKPVPPCETVSCDETQDVNNIADATVSGDCDSSGGLIYSVSNGFVNQFTYPLISVANSTVVDPPGSLGTLCVTGQIGRYIKDVGQFDSNGNYSMDLMNATTGGGGGNVPVIGGNIVGGTWNMQSWHRDGQNPARWSSLTTFGPVQ